MFVSQLGCVTLMSKNVLSKGAYNPTAATSRRASSWVFVFLEKELGWTVSSAGSILTSLHFADKCLNKAF